MRLRNLAIFPLGAALAVLALTSGEAKGGGPACPAACSDLLGTQYGPQVLVGPTSNPYGVTLLTSEIVGTATGWVSAYSDVFGVAGASLGVLHTSGDVGTFRLDNGLTLYYTSGVNSVGIYIDPAAESLWLRANRLRIETLGGAPASSSSPCDAGEIAFDSDYLYRCVAQDTWKRAALSAW